MKTLFRLIIIAIFCLLYPFCGINGQSSVNRQTMQPERPKYNSIKEALNKPWSKLFYIERTNGNYKMGDTVSHFNSNKNFEHLTFDISNNKVLANIGIQGSLKRLTVYRDTYFANCNRTDKLKDNTWPGVWVAKDNSSFGPYSFTLDINGQNYDLDKVDWDFRTGLLENLFPITEFKGPNSQFTIKLLTYAPVSSDGKQRIRGLVYGLFLENKTADLLTGTIHLPKLFTNNRQNRGTQNWSQFDPYEYEMALGDTEFNKFDVPFTLKKGENIWVPIVFNMLGDSALQEINNLGTLAWLNHTARYFNSMMGQIETPGDSYLGEFFKRQVMSAFGSIAMSESGKIAGSNWGSYPATRQIWLKDLYYSSLPFMLLDKSLAQKLILWFNEYGVRPKGSPMKGGVNHSLGISMASFMLAGLYYESSGDKQFFLENQKLKKSWDRIMTELMSSKQDPEIWLFPSKYISDGPIQLDYHTDSNVCAWFALKSYARILKEIYNEPIAASKFQEAAEKVHDAILEKCTVNGPYGRQFIEGVYRDGRKAPMESNGEESDVTLMPFYGFLSWDDSTYLNYMKFSMSEHNIIFQPKLHAITQFGVPSTASGYMKGICAGTDKGSLFGEHGFITEVRRITDADGSIWWWNYGGRSKEIPEYGQVVRGLPGKAGWFSGIYASVFIARQLGLSFQTTSNSLRFATLMPSSGFKWSDISFAGNRYSINYQFDNQSEKVSFISGNPEKLKMEFSLPMPSARKGFQTYINGSLFKDIKLKRYFNQDYISFSLDISEKGEIKIQLLPKEMHPE